MHAPANDSFLRIAAAELMTRRQSKRILEGNWPPHTRISTDDSPPRFDINA
jgi:hypothetical protein